MDPRGTSPPGEVTSRAITCGVDFSCTLPGRQPPSPTGSARAWAELQCPEGHVPAMSQSLRLVGMLAFVTNGLLLR